MDAREIAKAAGKWLFQQLVSINELFIVSHDGTRLVVRVTDLNMANDDEVEGEEDEEGAAAAAAPKHCFRGLVTPQTIVYVGASTAFYSHRAAGLALEHGSTRPVTPIRNAVHVATSDGEIFPVRRQLLRPCISLTKAVRDRGEATPQVGVDVDCATFDRVLLFLEAASRAAADAFVFDINSLEDLSRAACTLGCRELRERCARRLGDFESRIRMHRWADVVRHNEAGGCWVTMDGARRPAPPARSPPRLNPAPRQPVQGGASSTLPSSPFGTRPPACGRNAL